MAWFCPKISFKVARRFYLGAGVLFTQSFIHDFDLSAGIGYGLVTYAFESTLDSATTVRASSEWLRRVFDVVVDNAVEAMSQSTAKKLTVAAAAVHLVALPSARNLGR